MNSCELTMSIAALANAIASKLTPDETELAAAVFVQLGETLSTISAREKLCENNKIR